MAENNFNAGLALGGLDLVLIIGTNLYFAKKATELSVRLDKIEDNVKHQHVVKSSSGYHENNVEADIDELYDRVEAMESSIEKITERQKRSEFLLNQIINALKDNSITINIDAQHRRMSSRKKHPTSDKPSRHQKDEPLEDEEEDEDDNDDKEDNSDVDLALNMINGKK